MPPKWVTMVKIKPSTIQAATYKKQVFFKVGRHTINTKMSLYNKAAGDNIKTAASN